MFNTTPAFYRVLWCAAVVLGQGCQADRDDDGPLASTGAGQSGGSDGGTGGDGDGAEDGLKLDVDPGDTDGGPGDCSGPPDPDEVEFSYIWIANSSQGTVSKIDTFTGTELARYFTAPGDTPQPSRTSVNLRGDVAVASRGPYLAETGTGELVDGGPGHVSKIAARERDCVDRNGNGTIETSADPTDIRPWGEDECVLWDVEIPSIGYRAGPRPIAWEGAVDQGGCALPNPRLWVGYYDYHGRAGVFWRLDGSTGTRLDEVRVPGWGTSEFGPYGGAVNAAGDFWVLGWKFGPLIRIDASTLAVDRHDLPMTPVIDGAYGMALDPKGKPWFAFAGAVVGFDPGTSQWNEHTLIGGAGPFGGIHRGVMVDREGRAWFAQNGGCSVGVIDTTTNTVIEKQVALPDCRVLVGVSIDVEGYVWLVDHFGDQALKVDPDTYEIELVVPGLDGPYTYSDMTGAGLNLVVHPPQG